MRFFIFLLIFPSLLYSQKKAPKCDAMDGLAINYFDEVPEAYTGAVKVCYQTGELSAHLTLKKGLSDGVSRQWHKNGVLRLEENFIEGVIVGTSKSWYPSGEKEAQTSFVSGKAVGLSKL